MKKFILALLFPGFAFAGGPTNAEFRGYLRTNELIRERFMRPQSKFELGTYIGAEYDPFGLNLLDLLGTYKSGFAGARFSNGTPNSLNMLIWHLILTKLAKDVAKLCNGEKVLDFND